MIRARATRLAKAIQRRGIVPQPFMGPALRKNLPMIDALFQNVGARVSTFIVRGIP
jgi:hypothetical protein